MKSSKKVFLYVSWDEDNSDFLKNPQGCGIEAWQYENAVDEVEEFEFPNQQAADEFKSKHNKEGVYIMDEKKWEKVSERDLMEENNPYGDCFE